MSIRKPFIKSVNNISSSLSYATSFNLSKHIDLNRHFTHSSKKNAAISDVAVLARRKDKEQSKKAAAIEETRRVNAAKMSIKGHPLYMDIPKALRYIRAVEVGRSGNEAVICLTTLITKNSGVIDVAGSVKFPHSFRGNKIIVFTQQEKAQEIARNNGATLVGGIKLVEQIKNGEINLDFQKALATPDMLSSLRSAARILGPVGLLPNAKRGTVTDDIESALAALGDFTYYKQYKDILTIPIGRSDFTDIQIMENLIALVDSLKETKNNTKIRRKTVYFSGTTITSTHSPAFRIDLGLN